MYIIETKIDCKKDRHTFNTIKDICDALGIVIKEHLKCNSIHIEVAYEFDETEEN